MSENNKLYTHQRFIFMSLDPIHIGTGGYYLGRVDNAIIREPGTKLPKIPGTSFAGTTRNYAAMRYGKSEAAGLHKELRDSTKNCPIIYTFGTATETNDSQRGKVSIGDAQILLFPIHSMAGPIWISTKEIFECAGFQIDGADNLSDGNAITSLKDERGNFNLGWILLKITAGLTITPPDILSKEKTWELVSNRIILVTPKLFSQIVNSNLEVRTSVAINPETGAAEDRALFTYEAIPRTTWLWCDIIEDDYLGNFPKTDKQFKDKKENAGEPLEETWKKPLDTVKSGLKLIEYLGIGGMGTRGFGRMKLVCDWEVKNDKS